MHIEILDKPNFKKVRMLCDDIIDDKILKFPMTADLFSRTSFNVILGKMGQGKTSLITNLVKTVFKKCFEHIIIFIPAGSRRSIENDIYGKNLPSADLYDTLTEENLDEVIEKIEEAAEEGENTLLIIDDFQAALKDPDVLARLQKIVTRMRHMRTTIFILQQNFQKMAKFLRELVTNVITFNTGKSQLTKLFEETVQIDKDKFQALTDIAFRDKNDWIAINVNGARNIYRGFDRIVFDE
jgi:KaiC/GvpD/RAD55 family RecA-like ATPase